MKNAFKTIGKLRPCQGVPLASASLGLAFFSLMFIPSSVLSASSSRDCEGCPEMVQVENKRPFSIGRFEVTRAQYAVFVEATKYDVKGGCMFYDPKGDWTMGKDKGWRDPGFSQSDDQPAACISWNDALAYTQWLSAKTSKSYRLPTAREWEVAARSGAQTLHPWGDDPDQACDYANTFDESSQVALQINNTAHDCRDKSVYTAPVGSYKANGNGLFDMIGNVFEWTSNGLERGRQDVRGGCWYSDPGMSNIPFRFAFDRAFRGSGIGFRVVRDGKD